MNLPDFLIVLNRLFRMKQQSEQRAFQGTDGTVADILSNEERIFSNYAQSLMRREDFKIAVELFGFREEDLPLEHSSASLAIIKQAIEGKTRLS